MATIKICDRCGAVINPADSMVYVYLRNKNGDPFLVNKEVSEIELCYYCAMQIREVLKPVTKKEGADNG